MSAIAEHPRAGELAKVIATLALSAAEERRARIGDGLEELLADHKLDDAQGTVAGVDVVAALRRLAAEGDRAELSHDERDTLAALFALGIRESLPTEDPELDALARKLCWLACHTFIDVLPMIDDVIGSRAEAIWQAAFRLVRDSDGRGARDGRAEALAAIAALSQSGSSAAESALRVLEDELTDPLLRAAAIRGGEQAGDEPDNAPAADDGDEVDEDAATRPRPRRSLASKRATASGELVPAPLGPIGLFVSAITGVLLLRWLLRFVTRVLLRCQRPTELKIDPTGITLSSRLDVLGRTVRASETVIPYTNLARAAREIRYPRLAMYAGLIALAIGSFIGTSIVSDGSWGRSPSLILLGAAIFGVGVLVDLLLSSLWPSRRGRYRLVFVLRTGRTLALEIGDAKAADDAIRTVGERAA
jgi:hypothetical protein